MKEIIEIGMYRVIDGEVILDNFLLFQLIFLFKNQLLNKPLNVCKNFTKYNTIHGLDALWWHREIIFTTVKWIFDERIF